MWKYCKYKNKVSLNLRFSSAIDGLSGVNTCCCQLLTSDMTGINI